MRVGRRQREALNGHRAGVVYLTGLSGAGKSTLAAVLEQGLHERGMRTYVLDGDELRCGLCRDLGFSDANRIENVRRVTEIAWLMVDAGLLVIAALISPFRAERDAARARFARASSSRSSSMRRWPCARRATPRACTSGRGAARLSDSPASIRATSRRCTRTFASTRCA